ncbi:PadR family transcriptional regulator [Nakamurella lactea]|jgi:DNA-binding PadR family transcriptional regulator|uniref:PadR family transcriptional regulator n=1 Tax=Nakamurella lactea TaxID=459515 RepID=UPI00040FD3DB|nr:PadR family transcriptional regulator [Nakamurella lactea]
MPADPSEHAVEPPALPTTSYAVLGLLAFGEELSGYDLKKWAEESIKFFYWSPSFSQIYSQLKRLAALGFVTSRDEHTDGPHDRRVYAITPAGRDAVQQWVSSAPLDPSVLKHSLLMRVWLGHLAEPEQLEELLAAHRARMVELAERSAAHEQGARRGTWAYPELALRWSHRYYQAEIALTDALLQDLRELATADIDETGHPAATP